MAHISLNSTRIRNSSLLFVCIGMALSCSSSRPRTEDAASAQQLTVSVSDDCPDSVYFKPEPRVVLLESTADNSQIRRISRILQDDDTLFIVDTSLKTVFIYTHDGKHIASVNNIGGGPGEYMELVDACLDTSGKQLILFGRAQERLMYYDYSGKFIREERLNGVGSIKEITYNNGSFYTVNHEMSEDDGYVNAINGQTLEADCLMEPYIKDVHNYTMGCMLSNNNNVIFTKRFDNGIYEIAGATVNRKYSIDFKELNIPQAYLDAGPPWDELISVCRENSHVFSIVDVCENSNYLSFGTNLPGFYVWPKSDDKTIRKHSFIFNARYGLYLSSMMNVDHTESTLAFFAEPRFILAHKEYEAAQTPELRKLIDTIRFDDNPVLFIYEFK